MPKRLAIALTLAVMLLSFRQASAQEQETWRQVAPKGEIFSVLMPAPVQEKTNEHPQYRGLVMRSYLNDSGQILYHVASMNVVRHFPVNERTFESFVKGFLESYCDVSKQQGLTCETTFARALKLDGYAGKQFNVSLSRADKVLHGVVRIYMTPETFYAIQVAGGKEGDASVDKFLKSFALDKAQPKVR